MFKLKAKDRVKILILIPTQIFKMINNAPEKSIVGSDNSMQADLQYILKYLKRKRCCKIILIISVTK